MAEAGIPPTLLGMITKRVFHFHERMYFDLIHGRRQILVIIQAVFGNFQPGRHLLEQEFSWPIVPGENIIQFIEKRENYHLNEWYGILQKSFNHVTKLIKAQQRELHPNQDPPPELINNQKRAKFIELAASGFAYLEEEVFPNTMFVSFIEACQICVSRSEGEDQEVKQAALNIWKDKIDKLRAKVKKVLDLKNWLLRVAEVYYDQREGEPSQSLKQQLYRVLRRAYFLIYWTPNEVPTDDFANLVWKLFDFKLEKPKGLTTWYDPKETKKDFTLIKGSLGEMERRRRERDPGAPAEEVGEPSLGEEGEPGEDIKPDTKHEVNIEMFKILQDFHRELIWGRRQILIVIQLLFGNFDKQEFAWPDDYIEPNSNQRQKFDIEIREGLRLDDWNRILKNNLQFVLNLLYEKQEERGQCVRLEKLSENSRRAKYIDLALMGLDHLERLTGVNNAIRVFGNFRTEGLNLLMTMREGSADRNEKQIRLDQLHEALTFLLKGTLKPVRDGEISLKSVAEKLIEPSKGGVNFPKLKYYLSDIYYQLHSILDHVPLRMFCDVAYEIFGWNWTIAVKKENAEETMTVFERFYPFRTRRYKRLAQQRAAGVAPEEEEEAEEEYT